MTHRSILGASVAACALWLGTAPAALAQDAGMLTPATSATGRSLVCPTPGSAGSSQLCTPQQTVQAAGGTKVWISATGGSDSYNCTLTAPCSTWARAMALKGPGGAIGCIGTFTNISDLKFTDSTTLDELAPGGCTLVLASTATIGIEVDVPAGGFFTSNIGVSAAGSSGWAYYLDNVGTAPAITLNGPTTGGTSSGTVKNQANANCAITFGTAYTQAGVGIGLDLDLCSGVNLQGQIVGSVTPQVIPGPIDNVPVATGFEILADNNGTGATTTNGIVNLAVKFTDNLGISPPANQTWYPVTTYNVTGQIQGSQTIASMAGDTNSVCKIWLASTDLTNPLFPSGVLTMGPAYVYQNCVGGGWVGPEAGLDGYPLEGTFTGALTSGSTTLTVTNWSPANAGNGNAPYILAPGERIDGGPGSTILRVAGTSAGVTWAGQMMWICAQTSGTTGGNGHYTVTTGSYANCPGNGGTPVAPTVTLAGPGGGGPCSASTTTGPAYNGCLQAGSLIANPRITGVIGSDGPQAVAGAGPNEGTGALFATNATVDHIYVDGANYCLNFKGDVVYHAYAFVCHNILTHDVDYRGNTGGLIESGVGVKDGAFSTSQAGSFFLAEQYSTSDWPAFLYEGWTSSTVTGSGATIIQNVSGDNELATTAYDMISYNNPCNQGTNYCISTPSYNNLIYRYNAWYAKSAAPTAGYFYGLDVAPTSVQYGNLLTCIVSGTGCHGGSATGVIDAAAVGGAPAYAFIGPSVTFTAPTSVTGSGSVNVNVHPWNGSLLVGAGHAPSASGLTDFYGNTIPSSAPTIGAAQPVGSVPSRPIFGPTTVAGLALLDPYPALDERAIVTDATSCTFNATPTGGGSTRCVEHYNGAAWIAGG